MKLQNQKNENIKAAGLLILLLAAYYSSVVFGGNTFIPTIQRTYQSGHHHYTGTYWHENPEQVSIDPAAATQINLPSAYLEHHHLKQFKLPLWNPYSGLGRPYHADMNSYTFFIPLYAFKLFPHLIIYDFFLLFRLFFAGFFLYLLLRLYRCSFWISLAGACFFMFNSYFHAYINMDHLNVTMFLPAMAYFFTKFIFSRKKIELAGFILCSSGSFYGGNPNEFLLMHLFLSFYVLFFVSNQIKTRVHKKTNLLLIYGGSLIFSLLLSSLKWIPFLEFWKRSVSSRSMGTVGTDFFLTFKQFLSQFLRPGQIWEGPNYAGFLILSLTLFALFSLIRKRWGFNEKLTAFYMIVLFFGMSKVMGAPYINGIGGLPVLKNIHFVKYCSFLYFCMAVLASLSLRYITEAGQKDKTRMIRGGVMVVCLLLPHFVFWAVFQKTIFQVSDDGFKLIVLFSLFVSVSVSLLVLKRFQRKKIFMSAGVLLLAVLAVTELRFNNHQYYEKRFKINDRAPYTQFLLEKNQPFRSMGLDFTFMPNCNLVYPLSTLNRLFAMRLKRPTMLLSRLVTGKFNSGMGQRYTKEEILDHPTINLLNTKYYISESILDSININPDYAETHNITSLIHNPLIHYTQCGDLYHYSHSGWKQWADSTIQIPLHLPKQADDLKATGLAFDFDSGKRQKPENKLHLIISVMDEGKENIIYTRVFLPHRKKDAEFFPLSADLTPWAGKKVVLKLTLKNPCPQNRTDRCFFYGDLRIATNGFKEEFFHHAHVYRNPDALERGFMLYKIREIQDLNQTTDFMKKNPLIHKHTALIAGKPPSHINLDKTGEYQVDFLDYQSDFIRIKTMTTEDGVFVLSDAYFPGWKARLDGKKVDIYPAFGALRAVFIPKGQHILTFSYRPWTFYLGLVISLSCFLFLGSFLLYKPNSLKITGYLI